MVFRRFLRFLPLYGLAFLAGTLFRWAEATEKSYLRMFGFWSLVAAGLWGAREMARWQEEGGREELRRMLGTAGWAVEERGPRVWVARKGSERALLYLEGAPAYGKFLFGRRRRAAARKAQALAREVGASGVAVVFLRRKVEEGEEAGVALLPLARVVSWLDAPRG